MSERTEVPSSPGAVAAGDSTEDTGAPAATRRRRFPRPLTGITLIAAVFFMLASIGTPLLGTSVFAATDELSRFSPYYDSGLAGIPVQNTYMDDTYDAIMPNTMLYVDSVLDGNPAQWNPYNSGGTPLGAIPTYAVFSPLTIPYYLLPDWLAPAYAKLLELAVALLGGYLFLRRLSLSRPAAILGGMVFTSSAFMIMWTNWPQTRVAAMIPWVFWAAERLVQRRRPTDAVLLALPVAFMLLAGFPAVTALTLMSVGVYFLVRVFAEYWGQWRRLLGVTAGAAGAVAAGAALSAVQLLPFAKFYGGWLIEGRSQGADEHLGLPELTTAIAPHAMGSISRSDPPIWYLPHFGRNMVEAMSYVGAAAVVLVLVSVVLARTGRSLLPRGAWWVLVGMAVAWFALIYLPGPLALVNDLPVFSSNYIGRARSVLGMLLAALAAIGFELLLRNRTRVVAALRAAKLRVVYGVLVVLGAVAGIVVVWRAGLEAASSRDAAAGTDPVSRVDHLNEQMLIGLGFLGLAVLGAVLLYATAGRTGLGWRVTRFGAAAVLPVLVAVQGFSLTNAYYPRVDKDTFYPTTDVHAFLAENLGHQRFTGTGNAMIMGVDTAKKLRALTGHTFIDENFAELVRGIPRDPIPYPTHIRLKPTMDVASSPVLDRLGVRYFVTSPRSWIFGAPRIARGDGSPVTVADGTAVSRPVPGTGPVRAVGFVPTTSIPEQDVDPDRLVEVVVTDASGATVATAQRLTHEMTANEPFLIPVDADDVPADAKLTATFTLHTGAALTVRGADGAMAVSKVMPADDGLTVAHAGSSVVWERTTALPRIRWASSAISTPYPNERVRLLAGGAVDPDQVVLNEHGAPTDGEPADVEVTQDGFDVIEATVDARGAGYLVVADALQAGWEVTVDGEPAELVPADHGVVAVAVPEGRHTVSLRYAAPYDNAGLWLTVGTGVVLVGLVVLDQLLLRRQRRRPGPTE
ncbi:YfhO family protein [Actinophytocola gossypii]|uniref:YfhO family protein n=1 Tax=Actinophytocola gossypii TaxID=2812003 RepID=A0ABT2J9R6_9PSEU|nr:YfhO family protein [Actinophytocola gossypii]MCT2584019.1 YfhO family protein [Actinophytocola gossypii]